jgi:hypothetical protein
VVEGYVQTWPLGRQLNLITGRCEAGFSHIVSEEAQPQLCKGQRSNSTGGVWKGILKLSHRDKESWKQ